MKIQLRIVTLVLSFIAGIAHASLVMKPNTDPDLIYNGVILDGQYNPAITRPESLLGFEVGQRVASPFQIMQAIDTWQTESNRMQVIEYGRTHENRPLYAVVISSQANLANQSQILQDLADLSDPRKTSDGKAEQLMDRLPAIAWMAYSIHGNETSGADAAIAAIYHLIASEDADVVSMLDDMVVVIDPVMNPDGRDRFSKSLEQYRGVAPNVDDQSLLHRGDWPSGRTNHYFFDLNRDFFYLTQPETQGRVKLINQWRPQLMIDGHEMGAQDTYLMGPPRQPLNDNISNSLQRWAEVFARDQAADFDQQGWRYYTGEWFENWYPGYSNYAEYRGAMHILYEQARIAEDGVRRPEGTVQTYQESVHTQYISTMANLKTLAKHSDAMYKDYWQARKENVAKKGKYANRTFVVQATENHGRLNTLADKLLAQDIEVFTTTRAFTAKGATSQLGVVTDVDIKVGSLVIQNRQPEARLLAAIMEFEAGVSDAVMQEERQRVLRNGQSIMYDTTAWNLTMMYGLEAYEVPKHITSNLKPFAPAQTSHQISERAIAWFVNGIDDRALGYAAQLMERDIQVRVLDKSTVYGDQSIDRGAIVVTITDNRQQPDLVDTLKSMADKFGLSLKSFSTGFGEGDLPDWGGRHFKLLTRPQVGLLSHSAVSSYDLGATWWSIDSNLGIRHSQLDINTISRTDLRRYNVLILPTTFGPINDSAISALNDWIMQGGTLIAHSSSASKLAKDDGLSRVRPIQSTFADAKVYNLALHREWLSTQDNYVLSNTRSHRLPMDVAYPWDNQPKALSKDALKERDEWQRLFMPRGAFVAGRVDQQHWLSFGTGDVLPLLYGRQPVLMSKSNVEAVIRVGQYVADDTQQGETASAWYTHPEGQSLYVRMSGLLWPEAAQRIANSAYVTREKAGKGQVILFSGQPNFRGATKGVNRILLNAIVFGPGLGTTPLVNL